MENNMENKPYITRVKELRKARGYTQAQIATVLGISTEQVRNYERGVHRMPTHKYILLAQFYNVSLNYLAGITDTLTALY